MLCIVKLSFKFTLKFHKLYLLSLMTTVREAPSLTFFLRFLSLLNPPSPVETHPLNRGSIEIFNDHYRVSTAVSKASIFFFLNFLRTYFFLPFFFFLSFPSKPRLSTDALQSIHETGNADFQFNFKGNSELGSSEITFKLPLI